MSQATPECDRTNEQLLDYAYGELSGAPLVELEKHLPGCDRCQTDLAALKGTRRVMASLAPVAAPAGGLDSLLAYAEQQAKRQQKPARPKWLGWLMGAVPVAAAVVIVTTLSLKNAHNPAMQATEEAPNAVAVARPTADAEDGMKAEKQEAKAVPEPAMVSPKAPQPILAAAPTPAPAPPPPAEPARAVGHLADATTQPLAKTAPAATKGSAAGGKANLDDLDAAEAGAPALAEKVEYKPQDKRKDAPKKERAVADDLALGGDMNSTPQGQRGDGMAGPGGGSGKKQEQASEDAKLQQFRAAPPQAAPRDETTSMNDVMAQAAPAAPKPDADTRVTQQKQNAQKELESRSRAGESKGKGRSTQVAEMDGNAATVPATVQVMPSSEPAPAPVAAAEAPEGYAAREEKPAKNVQAAKPAAHAANKDAASTQVASAGAADPSAGAEGMAARGDHASAAAAYFSAYQASRGTAAGATALFNSATESQKAGLLGQAAMRFEQFASEFPKSASAPAALATAAQIRRSQEGEGAATGLEQNLLDRYPDSSQAQQVARQRRAHAPAAPMKKAKAAEDRSFDEDVERMAPAPAAPAASESAK